MRWLLPVLLLAAPAVAQTPPVAVYGIEHEIRGPRERVLVFAGEALDARLEQEAGALVLVLPGAVLDESAPRQVFPTGDARVRSVRSEERIRGLKPEVRITIVRDGDGKPELVQRGAVLSVELPRPERRTTTGIALQFESAPVAEIVDVVARATGETWIHDGSLTGRVTILAADRVSVKEATALLEVALRLTGHAALPIPGGGYRIEKLANAVALAPYQGSRPTGFSDAPVTTLRRLKAASAEQLVATLRPWVGSSALVFAEPSSNALLLAGPEGQVHVLLSIVEALDEGAVEPLWVRRVRNGAAEEAARILSESFANAPPGGGIEVWADARTGLLVVRASRATLEEARRRMDLLDRRPVGFGRFEVRRLLHADPDDVLKILEGLARGEDPAFQPGEFGVAVDGPTRSLVIRAEPSVQARLAKVIDVLDQPPQRVHVEVTILEIVADEALSLGFDAFIPFGSASSPDSGGFALLDPSGGGLLNPATAGDKPAFAARISRKPLAIPIVGPSGELVTVLIPRESAVITADESIVKSHVLMSPHLLLASGEEHEIFAGDEVPIPVSTTAASVGVPSTRVDVQRQDVGVRLRVKATLGQGDKVILDLDIETSSVRTAATIASGSQGPVIQTRQVTTKVQLADDEIALVGMGTVGEVQDVEVGVPWLKDVPGFGFFFRRTDTTRMKTHLVVTVQARLQRGPESDLAEAIRRRTGFERSMARVKTLERGPEPRWALRVATVGRSDDARDVANHFKRLGETTEVVEWEWHERPRHDVLLDGFDSLTDASQAALRARDEGFAAELVAVPAAAP